MKSKIIWTLHKIHSHSEILSKPVITVWILLGPWHISRKYPTDKKLFEIPIIFLHFHWKIGSSLTDIFPSTSPRDTTQKDRERCTPNTERKRGGRIHYHLWTRSKILNWNRDLPSCDTLMWGRIPSCHAPSPPLISDVRRRKKMKHNTGCLSIRDDDLSEDMIPATEVNVLGGGWGWGSGSETFSESVRRCLLTLMLPVSEL